MKRTVLILTTSAFLLAIPYLVAGWNERPMDDVARANAPGAYVELSAGKIHYLWKGPEAGTKIAMVHGVSIPHYIFAQASEALAASGFRVLLFDHFGHGYSDRPSTSYGIDFFDQEMVELFDRLEIDKPIHVAALSMGGVISAEFTARHPERVKSLSLFAPAGLRLVNETDSAIVKLFKTPVVGNWFWRVFARPIFLGEPKPIPGAIETIQGDFRKQADYEGYIMAIRDIYRSFPLSGRDETFAKLGTTSVSVLAIFGDADEAVHIDSASVLTALVPQARIEVIKNATHDLNVHHWREIDVILQAFLRDTEGSI